MVKSDARGDWNAGMVRWDGMPYNRCWEFNNGFPQNAIVDFNDQGFYISSNDNINRLGRTYYYFAFR